MHLGVDARGEQADSNGCLVSIFSGDDEMWLNTWTRGEAYGRCH